MPRPIQSPLLAELRAEMVAQSCIDPAVPLLVEGGTPPARPEFGPSVKDYFGQKHATLPPGERRCGGNCDLHSVQVPSLRRLRDAA
jgi:hypothetical protein